jgi:DNA-directed RNA polymerase II subunit RPB2
MAKKPVKKKVSNKMLGRQTKDSKVSISSTTASNGINNLNTDDIFRLSDFHFNKKNYIFRHLYDSYNKFLEEDVKNFLENGEHVFTENITQTTYYKYRFKFENIRIDEPTLSNGIEPMFPSDARHNRLTYSVKLVANVAQYQDIIDIASNQKLTKLVGRKEENFHIATIPLMVRSNWCSLIKNKDTDKNECEYDPGGYFIVNGNEKVIICQDRMVENKPLVFVKKDSGAMSYIVQVNSRSYKPHGMIQVLNVKIKKDKILTLRVPILNEVNVCAVFRALGLESDRDIINYITYDEYDTDMVDLIRISLDACRNEKGAKISTQEEAIDYLIPKLRVLKKYTETDKETKLVQRKIHLKSLLSNNFLPHVEGTTLNKAYYLGLMVNRLLRVYLKRLPLDDRDSYVNKRVDLPGDLMFELFRQQYKKLL